MTLMTTTLPARGLTQPPQANGAPIEAKIGAEFGWDQRVFTLGQDLQLDWSLRIPESWDGDSISVVVRARTSSVVNDCVFELHYEVIQVGTDRAAMAAPVLFDAQKTVTVPGVADTDFEIAFTGTPAVTSGDLVKWRLRRLGTIPADNTGTVNVTDVWFAWDTVPKLRGEQSIGASGLLTKTQFQNKLTHIDTSAGSVIVELPSLTAAEDLTKGWLVREGGNLAQIAAPVGYNLIYAGGTTSPYDITSNGGMVEVLYVDATQTYYIK